MRLTEKNGLTVEWKSFAHPPIWKYVGKKIQHLQFEKYERGEGSFRGSERSSIV